MRHENYNCNFGCAVEAAIEVIGGKWKGVVLYHLQDGTKRFNELRKIIPSVTQRMLTRQLRELEMDGVIERKVFAEIPPKVEYSITEFGKSLAPIIIALEQWGNQHIEALIATRRASNMTLRDDE